MYRGGYSRKARGRARLSLVLAALTAAAILSHAPTAAAGSIGKTTFSRGGVTRSGSSTFSSGVRSTPRSKFGGMNGSRGESAFSRSMSTSPRGKFPGRTASKGESTFSKSLRSTPRSQKFPGGNGGSDSVFSRNTRSTPSGKFPNSDLRSGDTEFSDSTRSTPKSDFKPEGGGDPEFSNSTTATARRKFPASDLKTTDAEFSDDLKTSIHSNFPLSDGSRRSGTGPQRDGDRVRGLEKTFSRALAKPRSQSSGGRGVRIGAVGAARPRSFTVSAPPIAGAVGPAPRAMPRLPARARGAIPIVVDGRTYYRHRGALIREVRNGSEVSYVLESR